MGDIEHLSAGVDEDSELWEQFNEYRDPGESKSASIRYLLRAGLEREGYIDSPREGPEPSTFAVKSYDLAVTMFQWSVVGLTATVIAYSTLPSMFDLLAVGTAATAVTSILATVTAAIAARVSLSTAGLQDRVLATGQEVATDGGQPADGEGGD
jgi:hypothetical protein